MFGVSVWTLVAWQALGGVGGAFAGEPMWKIWSQELFPCLLRASAQGATTFFCGGYCLCEAPVLRRVTGVPHSAGEHL